MTRRWSGSWEETASLHTSTPPETDSSARTAAASSSPPMVSGRLAAERDREGGEGKATDPCRGKPEEGDGGGGTDGTVAATSVCVGWIWGGGGGRKRANRPGRRGSCFSRHAPWVSPDFVARRSSPSRQERAGAARSTYTSTWASHVSREASRNFVKFAVERRRGVGREEGTHRHGQRAPASASARSNEKEKARRPVANRVCSISTTARGGGGR